MILDLTNSHLEHIGATPLTSNLILNPPLTVKGIEDVTTRSKDELDLDSTKAVGIPDNEKKNIAAGPCPVTGSPVCNCKKKQKKEENQEESDIQVPDIQAPDIQVPNIEFPAIPYQSDTDHPNEGQDREIYDEAVIDNSDKVSSITPLRFEAEDLDLSNFRIESASVSSGGQHLVLKGASGKLGQAAGIFNGEAGTYQVKVHYFDENDGQSRATVTVSDQSKSFAFDKDLPSAWTQAAALTSEVTHESIFLKPGDRFSIEAQSHRGEFARIDAMEFIPLEIKDSIISNTPSISGNPNSILDEPIDIKDSEKQDTAKGPCPVTGGPVCKCGKKNEQNKQEADPDMDFKTNSSDTNTDTTINTSSGNIEGESLDTLETPLHSDTALNLSSVESYGGGKQNKGLTTVLSENDTALQLKGNGWRKISLSHTVTPETMLSFEFRSDSEGEIHSIGFDNNNSVNKSDRQTSFQLFGIQDWGIGDFETYVAGTGWASFQIPVGEYFTGQMAYLTFGNDHDIANPDATSEFRNIMLHEPTNGINKVSSTLGDAFLSDPLPKLMSLVGGDASLTPLAPNQSATAI